MKNKDRKSFKEKLPQKPLGSCSAIFARLFRQYALRYWFRIFLGVFAGLIMGGAMHAYLTFLDFGISSLEANFVKEGKREEKAQIRIVDKLASNRTVQWVLKTMHIELEKDATEVIEKGLPENEKTNTKEAKDSGLFRKINSAAHRFGFDVSSDETLSFPLVCMLIVIMLFFFGIKSFGEFVNKYFLRWVGGHVVADIRADLFDNLQRQSLAFFSKNDVGQIISRCTYDAGTIEHSFYNCIAEMFISPMQIIVAITFLIQKALEVNLFKPTLILICATPIFLFPVYYLSKIIRRYQHKVMDRISLLVAKMQENLSGIRVVKSYNNEQFESTRFRKDNDRYFKAVAQSILADIFMSPLIHIIALSMGALFILLCFQYNISLGTLAVLGYAAQNAYKPLKELARMNANLQKCAAATERIFSTLDVNETLPEPQNPIEVPTLKHAIQFKDVTFSYENSAAPTINGLNLEIKKGQMVAIVGSTGSGKTTLANLLARFYDPQQGSISIDGTDLRSISNKNLRELIGIVAQDNFLFNETVAFNIGYGKIDATQEEIAAAAKRANADDFIMEDPLGYARPSGERGCLLSGGQKQRISIARAILKNPPILILDEATSALDTVTEQQVQHAITQLMKDRTVLAIAHRLSTIVNADKIVLLENGRIAEQGTHQELFDLNGKYRKLYDAQKL
ncbi:MAG: ABC transporter ATP-binding protein [Victivallales bacterium]|nr:ABC transporter ATP-binding protein [Victivallales bacterium]